MFDPNFALRRPKLERELSFCCSLVSLCCCRRMAFWLRVVGFIPKMAAAPRRDAFFRFGRMRPGLGFEAFHGRSFWGFAAQKLSIAVLPSKKPQDSHEHQPSATTHQPSATMHPPSATTPHPTREIERASEEEQRKQYRKRSNKKQTKGVARSSRHPGACSVKLKRRFPFACCSGFRGGLCGGEIRNR